MLIYKGLSDEDDNIVVEVLLIPSLSIFLLASSTAAANLSAPADDLAVAAVFVVKLKAVVAVVISILSLLMFVFF